MGSRKSNELEATLQTLRNTRDHLFDICSDSKNLDEAQKINTIFKQYAQDFKLLCHKLTKVSRQKTKFQEFKHGFRDFMKDDEEAQNWTRNRNNFKIQSGRLKERTFGTKFKKKKRKSKHQSSRKSRQTSETHDTRRCDDKQQTTPQEIYPASIEELGRHIYSYKRSKTLTK